MNTFRFSNLTNEKCLLVILIDISFITRAVCPLSFFLIFPITLKELCLLGNWPFAYKIYCKFFIPQLTLFFFS